MLDEKLILGPLQVLLSGSGTAKFEYQLSNDCVNYVEPASASDIATGFTGSSGPGGDGRGFYSFSPEPAKCMKIAVTETGTSNSVTVTVDLMIQ